MQLVGLTGLRAPTDWLTSRAQAPSHEVQMPAYHTQSTPVGAVPNLNLSAGGVIAIDAATGQVLYQKAADQPRAIASITKIFTALVILRDHNPDETVTVPVLPAYPNGAVTLGLVAGQQFKLGDLVKAALIPSANDAADTLAIYDAGSVANFATKLNSLAASWGLTNLHLANANGLDDTGNNASPQALASAARLLLASPSAKVVAATSDGYISDLSGHQYHLISTNELLKDPSFSGIKTGYTPVAGQCLLATSNIHGHSVITVVLGSQDRFGETKQLTQAIERSITWPEPPS